MTLDAVRPQQRLDVLDEVDGPLHFDPPRRRSGVSGGKHEANGETAGGGAHGGFRGTTLASWFMMPDGPRTGQANLAWSGTPPTCRGRSPGTTVSAASATAARSNRCRL